LDKGELIMDNKINLAKHKEDIARGIDGVMPNTFVVGYGWPEIKSHLKIGNMVIHNTHHFNWFQRKMWKLFFGFDIENVKENE
jgi:hypothetical protein